MVTKTIGVETIISYTIKRRVYSSLYSIRYISTLIIMLRDAMETGIKFPIVYYMYFHYLLTRHAHCYIKQSLNFAKLQNLDKVDIIFGSGIKNSKIQNKIIYKNSSI